MEWNIRYYISPAKDNPVLDFIESLSIVAQGKVSRSLDLLSQYGILLREPHVKKVQGRAFWELRILGSDSIRILYIAQTGRNFLLLHGFIKKTRKTPEKELVIADNRLKEYKARK